MSRKFRAWLDSGANIHSCREQEINLSDFGITSEDWDTLSEYKQDGLMREVAFDRADWGFTEIEEN